jgi:hypothetical protein
LKSSNRQYGAGKSGTLNSEHSSFSDSDHRPMMNQESQPAVMEQVGFQFSLGTLLLLVTLLSIWLGLLLTLPCVAVGGLVLFSPAIARTVAAVRILHRKGNVTTVGDKLAQLFASMVITGAAYVSSFLTGFAVLILAEVIGKIVDVTMDVPHGSTVASANMVVIAVLGLIFAALLGLWLFVKWWPRQRDFVG